MLNLSVVIPIFKESQNLTKLTKYLIENIKDIKIENYEILFVDDNSEDGTEEILKDLNLENSKIKYLIRNEKIKDLSKSCILGFENSLYENILVMDGDLQHDPRDIEKIIKTFKEQNADIVVGSRNLFNKKNEGLGIIRLTSSKILILIISTLLKKKTNDPMSGFFIFKKNIYKANKNKLYAKGYKILLDIIYSTEEKLKIIDVDINFRQREKGSSKMGFKVIYILVLTIIKNFFLKR